MPKKEAVRKIWDWLRGIKIREHQRIGGISAEKTKYGVTYDAMIQKGLNQDEDFWSLPLPYQKSGKYDARLAKYHHMGNTIYYFRKGKCLGFKQGGRFYEEGIPEDDLREFELLSKYLKRRRIGGLEKTATITTIVSLIGGLFFLSSNITGNVIGLNQSTENILGVVLLIVGLVGSFFWFRSRKR